MKKIIMLFIVLLGVLTLSACAKQRDLAPVFTTIDLEQTIEQGDPFNPKAGVVVEDREDGDISASIVVSGFTDDDVNFIGSQDIILTVKDSAGNETTAIIVLIIVAKPIQVPTLTGVNKNPEIYAGDAYDPKTGVTANDPQDGDITEDLAIVGTYNKDVVGVYVFSVSITDSDDNTVSESITLTVALRPIQVPSLSGVNKTPEVIEGDSYDPLSGVTASDPQDGTLTSSIEVVGTYNLAVAGEYVFTLSITDSDDNTVTETITLTVVTRSSTVPSFSGVNRNPVIRQNDVYNPLTGVTANDPQDGDLTTAIVVTGSYDIAVVGTYVITLSVTDLDEHMVTTTINLTVEELLPIHYMPVLIGVVRFPEIVEGTAYNPLTGVTASDPQDGNITSNIVVTGFDPDDVNYPGTYNITLSITDSNSNETTVVITLTVTATPVVYTTPTFYGVQATQTYFIGSGPYDPKTGVTATDTVDGNLTSSITVSGLYPLNLPGTYTIQLRVTNSGGIRATATILLTVANSHIPLTLTSDPITITLWHAMGEANQALLQKYADSFKLLYPNVTVIIPAGAGGYDTLKNNMINAITAQAMPNMVQAYPDHVAEYLNGKAVVNLNPYINSTTWGLNGEDDINDIIDSYLEENSQYDFVGTYYSLPFNKSTEVMIYNKTAFDALELDAPTTWQDVIAMAPQLKQYGDALAEQATILANPGVTGEELATKIAAAKLLVVPASYDSTGNGFITFTRQWGGAYTSLDYATFKGILEWKNNANTFAAMNFVLTNKSIITLPEYWQQEFASTPFKNQQTFITIGSSAGVRYNLPAVDPTTGLPVFELGVAPIPYNALMPDSKAVIQQGTNISLMKTGTAQEQLASWLFLKHLINTENTVDWAINTGYLPVRTSGYNDARYQTFLTNPTLNQLYISMGSNAAYLQKGYMFYDPAFIGSSRAREKVGLALEQIMLGNGNIQQALDTAYEEASLGIS